MAVLEGGYSIETALPYINTGIILAMAGLDFSHIREPDYDAASQRQPDSITDYLKQLRDFTFQQWGNRAALKRQAYPDDAFHTRTKTIFYDTDGIREHQQETVRSCDDCSGTIVTDSRCDDTGGHILGVTIPFHACKACRSFGEQQYDAAKPGAYTQMFLQDKDKDQYLAKV